MIPVRDGERHLTEQLEALCGESTTDGFEVVIADNGSTDTSRVIAMSFSDRLDLRVVDAAGPGAQGFARNVGATHARGDRILFLDHDDVVAPGYVEAMSRALDRCDFVAARIDQTSLNSGQFGGVRSVPQVDSLGQGPLPWAYGGTLGIKKAVFDRVGGFDPSLDIAAEDIDLCWRVQESGVSLVFEPSALLRYRFPDTYRALWRQGWRYGIGQVQVNQKHRDTLDIRPEPFARFVRGFAGSVRLAAFGRTPSDRGRGVFLLGRRLGTRYETARQWLRLR